MTDENPVVEFGAGMSEVSRLAAALHNLEHLDDRCEPQTWARIYYARAERLIAAGWVWHPAPKGELDDDDMSCFGSTDEVAERDDASAEIERQLKAAVIEGSGEYYRAQERAFARAVVIVRRIAEGSG